MFILMFQQYDYDLCSVTPKYKTQQQKDGLISSIIGIHDFLIHNGQIWTQNWKQVERNKQAKQQAR